MLQAVELAILDWIQRTIRCDILDEVMPVFTRWNDHGEIWIAIAVILVLMKRHRKAGLAAGTGLAIDLAVCNWTLKPLFGRIRPFVVNAAVQLLIEPPASASFPSGHTASSFAVVGALWAMKHPLWKPAAAIAVLIAFSRLYLYVHWPTDILGGIVVGWLCGVIGARIVRNAEKKRQSRRHKKCR